MEHPFGVRTLPDTRTTRAGRIVALGKGGPSDELQPASGDLSQFQRDPSRDPTRAAEQQHHTVGAEAEGRGIDLARHRATGPPSGAAGKRSPVQPDRAPLARVGDDERQLGSGR